MKIPKGENCDDCPFLFLLWKPAMGYDLCGNPTFKKEDFSVTKLPGEDGLKKLKGCLSAYPKGAAVVVTPLKKKAGQYVVAR